MLITEHKNGVTINPTSIKEVRKSSGYFVSITDNERSKADYRIVSTLKHKANELNLKKYFIGYWKDEKTGKHFFDLSLFIEKKKEAMSLAKIFNQKAIFENKTKQVIYCNA